MGSVREPCSSSRGLFVVAGPAVVEHFLAVAALDRMVWRDSAGAEFVPDGEHAWRVWAEHAYVAAVLDGGGAAWALLCGFAADEPGTHFLHKLAVHPDERGHGWGRVLVAGYVEYLDARVWSSLMTTAPANAAMVALSGRFGFVTAGLRRGYYRADEDRLVRVRVRGDRFA